MRRAVDGDEPSIAAAGRVHSARIDLLADAGLADNQHLALGRREPPQAIAGDRQRGRRGRHGAERRHQLGLDGLELDGRHHPEDGHVIADEHQRAVAQLHLALHARVVDPGAVLAAQVLEIVTASHARDAGVLPRNQAVLQHGGVGLREVASARRPTIRSSPAICSRTRAGRAGASALPTTSNTARSFCSPGDSGDCTAVSVCSAPIPPQPNTAPRDYPSASSIRGTPPAPAGAR